MKPIYHLDIQERTGNVILWVDTKDGSRPVLGWRSLIQVRDFTDMLFSLYLEKEMEHQQVNEVSDRLLEQAFGE